MGSFQMAVRTILPRHSISRGNPTLTESNRAICVASGMSEGAAALEHLLGVQASVDSVLLDALARLQRKLLVVEENVDHVRLEGEEIGDARDLGPRPQVRPRGPFALADVVVAGQALIGAERLSLGGDQRVLVDVLERHVPARCETRLVQHERPLAVGDAHRAALPVEGARGPAASRAANLTRSRLRRGSANRSRFGSGSGVRKRPTETALRGPCCQDNPIVVFLSFWCAK